MTSTTPPTLLHAFLAALDAGDADSAANLFAKDGLWLRPTPLMRGAGVGEAMHGPTSDGVMRGREEIRNYLSKRGKKSYRHRITSFVLTEQICFVEGVVAEPAEMRSVFMCRVHFINGEITRYTTVGTPATEAAIAEIIRTSGT